ncbi:MAG: ABC transporter permease, partial [Bacteroidaceae bacterium]|nr:ABC transporter permease [Bacteroidaceae bacterium]
IISDGRCKLVYHTGDDLVSQTYVKDLKYLELLTYGAIFTFLIPLIGVFGLVLFETRAKRKEIGIRKVFGATTRGILVMFNMQYLRTLMVCFILAAPVAYTLYNRWIESFAYRTPMHWWLFAVAFLIVAIVVCLTVTVQSWRAAKERPVETIMK